MEHLSLSPAATAVAAPNPTQPIAATATVGTAFATQLETARERSAPAADIVSGRLGLDLDSRSQISRVVYLDDQGAVLTTSPFNAARILRDTERFGIPLEDLRGLGEQLDAAGIGYRPYELYPGTGSDHGIDFDDLIAGGLGTAYDWRQDALVAAKGPGAAARLAETQALAERLGLSANTDVTHGRGIDPSLFAPLAAGNEPPRTQVMLGDGLAAWYPSASAATAAAQHYAGQVLDLSDRAAPGVPMPPEAAAEAERRPSAAHTPAPATDPEPSAAEATAPATEPALSRLESALEELITGAAPSLATTLADRLLDQLPRATQDEDRR